MKFKVFIRQNQTFIENFSIGLCCEIPELPSFLTTIRYNGPHGSTERNERDHHPYPHIHLITEEQIQSGSLRPQAKVLSITDKYNSFEEGLTAFLIDTNITN